ncbi:MAG: site-2 protease family protein, partial [Planctomycetota bacterium]
MSQFIYYLAIAVALGLVIYSIILHEIAHAYAANLMGDPTAAMLGRLTLNPIKHIDPFSTILVPMMTYIYMGFIFGGAKPVPINPYNFRNRAKGMMLSGIAGPAVNLVI